MANRTVRRQTFSIDTPNVKDGFLVQSEFKGLCDNKNDANIDQQSFADVENVYVDESGVLVSRPPISFTDEEYDILQEWSFGQFKFRYYRLLVDVNGKELNPDETYMYDTLYYLFVLRCTSHEMWGGFLETGRTYEQLIYRIPYMEFDGNYAPQIFLKEIEDKIFVWFGGISFCAFNTVPRNLGDRKIYYFEDATKYLYLPISKLIINGTETAFEEENFLTEAYIKRYHYSATSSINPEDLQGKNIEVHLNGPDTENTSTYLYDVNFQENQEKTLIYPSSVVGNQYHVDLVQTPRATVTMRYNLATKSIEVSFNARYFRRLPVLDDILGKPMLTRDGLYIVAFTKKGLAKCALVASESDDFIDASGIFVWEIEDYLAQSTAINIPTDAFLVEKYIPIGYFQSIDNFVYILEIADLLTGNTSMHLYGEFADGVYVDDSLDDCYFEDDKLKINFRFGAKTVLLPTHLFVVISGKFKYDNPDDDFEYPVGPMMSYRALYYTLDDGRQEFARHNKFFARGQLLPMFETDAFPSSAAVDGDIYIASSLSILEDTTSADYGYRVAVALSGAKSASIVQPIYNYYTVIECGMISLTNQEASTDDTEIYASDAYLVSGKRAILSADGLSIITDEDFTKLEWPRSLSIPLPNTGKLEKSVKVGSRSLVNTDNVSIGAMTDRRIHKLNKDGTALQSGNIESGDLIAFADDDYLSMSTPSNRFYIEKVVVGYTGDWVVRKGPILVGDFVRLRAYDVPIQLNGEVLAPWEYPSAPDGWQVGDDWPTEFTMPPPLIPVADNEWREWQAGDALPTGSVLLYGNAVVTKRIMPLYTDGTGSWYNIDGTLWTTYLDDEHILELDEYVNAFWEDVVNNVGDTVGRARNIKIKNVIPSLSTTLSEHYFVFKDTQNLLEVSTTKRDVNKLLSDGNTDFLLYLPKKNEQIFANTITNIHPISTANVAVFTETDVWYIGATTLNDEPVYFKAVKSKLPFGCRDGDMVITALDGEAIMLATSRGIAALAPQNFVSTEERALTYLSDAIQDKYQHFYNDTVKNVITDVKPMIKMVAYRYWLLFYKYLDREILALDTRNGTWWNWDVPYPIRELTVDDRLKLLLQTDFSLTEKPKELSMLGVSYLWCDKEIAIDDEYNTFPSLNDTVIYQDATIDGALNGDYEYVYENEFVPERLIMHHAVPTISWHLVSQKLHFGQLNNYKGVYSITLNTKGTRPIIAKMSLKSYRDFYHPEQSSSVEIKVNDLRTFIYRMNLMHLVNFQYRLENEDAETPQPLRLNALSIKFGVKERIR